MDYQSFQEFMQKYDFDQNDIKLLNEIMTSCVIPQTQKKPKKKLYSLRLDQDDMQKIKQIAQKESIPYQTLIGSILHKYVTGQIK
ncbi:MAG TPA: CopG family antitoxin [Candidatus Absconditabacterales bacterium]|nr:CopG family antitoxin [Candidatus Absconditabacterales bacterium]